MDKLVYFAPLQVVAVYAIYVQISTFIVLELMLLFLCANGTFVFKFNWSDKMTF